MELWYSPIPEGLSSKLLRFVSAYGSAWNHHRDLVVPNLGSIRFVRQVSWRLRSTIHLQQSQAEVRSRFSKSQAAHALEALGSKALWVTEDRQIQKFLLGSRKLRAPIQMIPFAARWNFSRPANYVQYHLAPTDYGCALKGLGVHQVHVVLTGLA